ncbi:auxin-responsive protein IAA28-like [Castanea sativa]|uniref:auxin-responsive protein IAA28-like n=1 Tax=Castanea sativa TaxID=21020 RepID=UPI003F65426B
MELQLGLALPTNPTSEAFDLNYYGFEANNKEVDRVIGPCYTSSYEEDIDDIINIDNNKRSFGQAFENSTRDRVVPRTLPLLLWNNNNHPSEEDDPKDLENHHSLFAANKNVGDGDGDGVVGWPPIKSWRKRLCHENQVVRAWNNQMVENGYVWGGRRASNSMYVKVKMEGVVIARKVDLSQHHSFETLTDTLMDMFRKWSEACEKNSNNYKLIYQDREGDWLFAQDVPWRTFIRSVQRLKLLKSSG